MSTYKHYVPVLRWKQAEWIALRELSTDLLKLITPLIEITPHLFGTMDLLNLDREIERTVKNLQKIPLANSIFFDTHLVSSITNEEYLLKTLFKKTNKEGISLVPVTSLTQSRQHNFIVKKIIKSYGCGFCLRIDIRNHDLSNINVQIKKICTFFDLKPQHIDLVVDYKLISSEDNNPSFKLLSKILPYLQSWRSFSVVSGAFPKDLTGFSIDIHSLRRLDWLMWLEQLDKTLHRIPAFGDYTIQHPIFYKPIQFPNPSASIRYSANNDWLIFRGEALRKKGGAGYAQYPAHAQLLIEMDEFKGRVFSAGDNYIYEMAQRANNSAEIDNYGGPFSWLKAGIIHHLTLVATQISNLNEILADS